MQIAIAGDVVNIATTLAAKKLSEVDLQSCAYVDIATTVCDTVTAMNAANSTCAVVTSARGDLGVFTDRDLVRRVVGRAELWGDAIGSFMTADPNGLPVTASALEALQLMNEQRLRHVLVYDAAGSVVGMMTDVGMLRLVQELLHAPGVLDEPELSAQHGLLFVDFTGLTLAKPVTATRDEPLASVIHQMSARSIGSILVVDDRGSLIGIFTERDVQEKVACTVEDLAGETVGGYMTIDPFALSPRDMIADGLREMTRNGFTHLPLIAESGRPVAMASFRDLAEYLEVSITAVR